MSSRFPGPAMRMALAVLLLALFGALVPLRSRPPITGASTGKIRLYEQERKLTLLPLSNETKQKRFDYVARGLRKVLKTRLASFGFIAVARRRRTFGFESRLKDRKGGKLGPGSKARGTGPALLILRVTAPALNRSNYRSIMLYGDAHRARLLESDYVVSGRLIGSAEETAKEGAATLQVELRLFNAVNRRVKKYRFSLNSDRPFANIEGPARAIFAAFSGSHGAVLTVESARPGVRVYLSPDRAAPGSARTSAPAGRTDGVEHYLGRTPLEKHVVPGRYVLRLERENFRQELRRVVVTPRGARLEVRLRPLIQNAGLVVTSAPPGARVYLNADLLGKTPLKKANLPAGTHRLRVALKGHVDRFIGVTLAAGRTRQLQVVLAKGDTNRYYAGPRHTVLDWTYFDLHFYSLLSTLAFYAGYVFFEVEEDRIRDSLRPEIPALLGVSIFSDAAGVLSGLSVYQFALLEANSRKAARASRRADLSAGGGVVMFVAACVFLYFDLATIRDVGETASRPARPNQLRPLIGSRTRRVLSGGRGARGTGESYTYGGWSLRF